MMNQFLCEDSQVQHPRRLSEPYIVFWQEKLFNKGKKIID